VTNRRKQDLSFLLCGEDLAQRVSIEHLKKTRQQIISRKWTWQQILQAQRL
jgi:hypothetical protein